MPFLLWSFLYVYSNAARQSAGNWFGPGGTPRLIWRTMAECEALARELFIGNAVTTVVVATGRGAPRGKASKRITEVVEMLLQTVSTRQTYSFMNVLSKVPSAVAALGWILDRCEQRASKFLSKLSPAVDLDTVVSAEARDCDGAILLRCIGNGRLVSSKPMSQERSAAILSALRMCIFPRNLLPELFSDARLDGDEEPAWSVHGVGSIGAFMDLRLGDEGPVAAEREHFVAHCRAEVLRLIGGYERAVNGGSAVKIPRWAAGVISCSSGAAAVAIADDDTRTPLASGKCWLVSRHQFPAGTKFVEVAPSAEGTPPGVSIKLDC